MSDQHNILQQYPLDSSLRSFLKEKIQRWSFSFQETRKIVEMAIDLQSFQEESLLDFWPEDSGAIKNLPQEKKKLFQFLQKSYDAILARPKDYSHFVSEDSILNLPIQDFKTEGEILGRCPVASSKTRCCNLYTLDSVKRCQHDCTYCSIQFFYHEPVIKVEANLREKLKSLELDPHKRYHIGTGQGSDSLLMGNTNSVLTHLFEFAQEHPNVILELKSKSDNIADLLQLEIPNNVIVTWSLNPQIIIDHEEKNTASLEQRLRAAEKIRDKGTLVGFHFHPMVYFKDCKSEYLSIAQEIIKRFSSSELAMISMGTVTFSRKVINFIRKRGLKSKILQMPLEEIAGKFSYPFKLKQEMFQALYQAFTPWHEDLFFYMCMEDQNLWKPVFGKSFEDNDVFEAAMLDAYMKKIRRLQK